MADLYAILRGMGVNVEELKNANLDEKTLSELVSRLRPMVERKGHYRWLTRA
ncbi:MAG: hypothetical protein ABI347_04635 [Nitrososphaera sp.]|jgi:hypothetical protein